MIDPLGFLSYRNLFLQNFFGFPLNFPICAGFLFLTEFFARDQELK